MPSTKHEFLPSEVRLKLSDEIVSDERYAVGALPAFAESLDSTARFALRLAHGQHVFVARVIDLIAVELSYQLCLSLSPPCNKSGNLLLLQTGLPVLMKVRRVRLLYDFCITQNRWMLCASVERIREDQKTLLSSLFREQRGCALFKVPQMHVCIPAIPGVVLSALARHEVGNHRKCSQFSGCAQANGLVSDHALKVDCCVVKKLQQL